MQLLNAKAFAAPWFAPQGLPFYQFDKSGMAFWTLHHRGDVFYLKFMLAYEATKFSHNDTSHFSFAYIIHDFARAFMHFTKKMTFQAANVKIFKIY